MLELTGHHGTTRDNSVRLLATGFRFSPATEWMGVGVYFFGSLETTIDGEAEARWWATQVKRFTPWAILEANIKSDNYLDFAGNRDHIKTFDQIKKHLVDIHVASKRSPATFEEYLIYKLIDERIKVDFIRAFMDAGKAYLGFHMRTVQRPQIQICVKNLSSITSLKSVVEGI